MAAWTLVGCLIVIQYLLFRQHVLRELVWAYPAHHDQSNFLQDALVYYHAMLEQGFWRGLWSGFASPRVSSPLLPVQGALVFYLFGPKRLNALTLVFAYFALLQCAIVYAVRRATGSWMLALVALGALLSTGSRYFEAGGTADFRADSIASSLYGVALCCFLLSEQFQNRKWSWLTVASAGLLVWFRPIAITYLAGTGVLLWLTGQLRTGARYIAVWVALVIPMIVICRQAIYSYYVVGHVTGPEKQIRAMEQGVRSVYDNLSFYPRSLFNTHLGDAALILWACVLAVCLMALLISRIKSAPWRRAPTAKVSWNAIVLGLWTLTPLVILTADYSKSAVVGSISTAPAVLFGVYVLSVFIGAVPQLLQSLLVAGTLLAGITIAADAEGRRFVPREDRADALLLTQTFRRLGTYCSHFNLREPKLATDRIVPHFMQSGLGVMMFERAGVDTRPKEVLSHDLYRRTAAEAEQAALEADIAIVTTDPIARAAKSFYPFDQSASEWQRTYSEIVARDMLSIARVNLSTHAFEVFVRPRARLEGGSSGWLTAEGANIQVSAAALRHWPRIRLNGKTVGSKYLQGPLSCTVSADSEASGGQLLPTRVSIAPDESYEIQIDASGLKMPADRKRVMLRLWFDRHFVPNELGLSDDTRQLVLRLPTRVTMMTGDLPNSTQVSLNDLLLR